MKKIFLFIVALFFSVQFANAQTPYTLEEVDMSDDTTSGQNTYMMDINNRGYSCGYYTTTLGDNFGFIITRKGVLFPITDVVIPGCFDIKVVSINDNDVALVSTTIAGVTTLYKIYVYDENYSGPFVVNGLGQNPVNALKINNKNDISGWYQGVNSRWLFILHDSIIPPAMPQWQASRYMVGPTYYNTWGNGMDTNNNVAGYYLDAPNFYPFLHNATNNTYQILTAPNKTKVWDMNNNNVMVGEYQQGNGYYMAFVGNIVGNTLNTTSLANIFHNNTIQSVANGINDKGYVVGNFVDPNTNTWKGFIYRPNQDKYEYPGFSFVKHTWHSVNDVDTNAGNTDAHWNKDFFDQYVDYDLYDTYTYNDAPLNDHFIQNKYHQPYIPNTLHPDWKSFAIETDKKFTLNGTPHDKYMYKYFKKYSMFDKYVKFIRKYTDGGTFNGDCYGFSITALLNYVNPTSLNTRYDVPLGLQLSTATNMDSVSKGAITRGQMLQFNNVLRSLYPDGIYDWLGLYRTKTYMSDTAQKVNIRTLSIVIADGTDTGGHAIFPYQIKTPQKLPFKDPVTFTTESDTVMIYDCNFPLDSTQYLAIKSNWIYSYSKQYSPSYNVIENNFNRPTYTEITNYPYAALKKSRNIDTIYDFTISANTDYVIQKGIDICSKIGANYSNGISNLYEIKGTGVKAFYPLYFKADSSDAFGIHLNNYKDTVMYLTHTTDDITMGISRRANLTENDNLTVGNRRIFYGNTENFSKYLSCFYTQTEDGAAQSVNLLIDSLLMQANDSILTLVPHDYSYQIIHPGGNNIQYNLEMYVLYQDSVKMFVSNGLPLSTNTSHLIDPYYVGANGLQTVIYVDNGLNGNNDDTLFIPEVPLSLQEHFQNVDYVKLFPNPAKNTVNIDISKNTNETFTLVEADMYGKILYKKEIQHNNTKSSHSINISQQATGVYYLILYDKYQKAIFVEKVIKE